MLHQITFLDILHWYLSIHTAKRFQGNKMEKKSKIVKKVLKSVRFPHISYFLFLRYWHFLYIKYNNMWDRFPRSTVIDQYMWERNPKFNKIKRKVYFLCGKVVKYSIYCDTVLYFKVYVLVCFYVYSFSFTL